MGALEESMMKYCQPFHPERALGLLKRQHLTRALKQFEEEIKNLPEEFKGIPIESIYRLKGNHYFYPAVSHIFPGFNDRKKFIEMNSREISMEDIEFIEDDDIDCLDAYVRNYGDDEDFINLYEKFCNTKFPSLSINYSINHTIPVHLNGLEYLNSELEKEIENGTDEEKQ